MAWPRKDCRPLFDRGLNGLRWRITHYRWRLGNLFFKNLFRVWQCLGFHITRNHYYEPVPDTRLLPDWLWQRQSELVGIEINETSQLQMLSEFVASFKDEYDSFPLTLDQRTKPYEYCVNCGSFESVDGEVLYCMIRHFKPRRIFEIGSGNSTYLSAQALLKNNEVPRHEATLVAYEPYPSDVLRRGFPGLSKLVPASVQRVPLSEFQQLEENDILFIDSSHVLRIGNDVQFEYLELLHRLNKGVHVHDIFLPVEYPQDWVLEDYRFWTEQYLLQAFLTFNQSFEVLWAGHYMHLRHPDKLTAAFRSYNRSRTRPGSFWMRRIR